MSSVVSAPATAHLSAPHAATDRRQPHSHPTPLANLPRTHAEAVAARERSLIKILAELGVTPDEASLFIVIQYGIGAEPEDLPRHAAADVYRLSDSVSEESCRGALAACLAKGWLQVIDDAALAEIAARLRAGCVLGPVYGLPSVGKVDFTQAGADLWVRIRDCDGPAKPFASTDVVSETTARYFTTRAAAEAEAESAWGGYDDTVAVSDPTPTGPWRAEWWRQFPQGYRIDIEERRQWQGRCSRGGEECYFPGSLDRADPVPLRRTLDCRNVALAEFVVLAAMEGGPRQLDDHDFPSLVRYADRDFGSPLTEAECRVGLDACLRYGWLRVLDEAVIDEVRALVRCDSVALALPRTAELRPVGHGGEFVPASCEIVPVPARERWGQVDFTLTGAALYRAISAEWLGDDWEDGLQVSNGYFREEHRYCTAESGFRHIVAEYEAEGQVVRSKRVVPIGPWCVNWWEQFPAGFRMELEISGDVGG